MYLSHFSLNKKPFQITANPKFIWLGEKHAEALATFQYGLQENKGILLLTGDVGTGKTAVINTLLKKIEDNVIAVMIPDPGLDPMDLYHVLANEFKIDETPRNKREFLNHLKPYLYETYYKGKSILLIIDEAQNISNELLEEIRLLSNIELADTKLINIFIVGQNEFNSIIAENRNRAFKQRISIRYHLDPLTNSETHEYITHRLQIAGSDKEIFSSRAINDIHFFSNGFPRLINAICDLALLTGYSSGQYHIDEKVIKECAQELKLSGESEDAEKKKRNGVGVGKQTISAKNIRPGWKLFNFASIVACIIMITVYVNFNLYPNNSQIPAIPEDAFRNYKRYEEKIDLVKNEIGPANNKWERASSRPEKIDETTKTNIGSKNGFQQSYIIHFENASKEFSQNSIKTLAKLAGSIRDYPNSEIIIEGHTDSHGNYWHNKKFSSVRANLVKNYFVNHGIISSRIKTIDLGAEYPIVKNDNEFGGQLNNRVEIKIISSPQNYILSKN